MSNLPYVSNAFLIPEGELLAKKIVKKTINYTKLKISGSYSSKLKDTQNGKIEQIERFPNMKK